MTPRTQRQAQRPSRWSGKAGFSMIEVSLALTVIVVALMAMSASTLRMHSLRRQNRERSLAQNTVRAIAEHIPSVAAQAQSDPGTWGQSIVDAVNAGGLPGPTFGVANLRVQEGNLSVGDVFVITDETLTDADIGLELGMPRDLDGDGLVDNADVTGTARILPVDVRARWTGVTGQQTIVHPFYVMGY